MKKKKWKGRHVFEYKDDLSNINITLNVND